MAFRSAFLYKRGLNPNFWKSPRPAGEPLI